MEYFCLKLGGTPLPKIPRSIPLPPPPLLEYLFFRRRRRAFIFLHRSRKWQMRIKTCPPLEGIFCALLFPLSSTIFCVFIREGGRNEPFYSSAVIFAWVKASFKILAILYTCFRFKNDVFRKKMFAFEAVNRKNNS